MDTAGVVLLVGSEPAAFSCALELVESGCRVEHVHAAPGLVGSTRDIGLAYPELGEPWERLAHSLGEELALEYHAWSKTGVEDLARRLPALIRRGSRLALTRTERETRLLTEDAVRRSRPDVGDEVRLMSGAAVSNYAPVHGSDAGCFETHAAAFAPVKVLNALSEALSRHALYRTYRLEGLEEWLELRLETGAAGVAASCAGLRVEGDLCVVAAGLDAVRVTGRMAKALIPLRGQAFRSPPLKEKTRGSVVGLSASWGHERYRFDDDYRLLGCGVDPTGGGGEQNAVDPAVMKVFIKRARQLFADLDAAPEELMQWAVEFTSSRDGLPLIGPLPGEPRIQIAEGFSLSAWSRGWEGGRRVARAIAAGEGEPESPLLRRLTPRRFVKPR